MDLSKDARGLLEYYGNYFTLANAQILCVNRPFFELRIDDAHFSASRTPLNALGVYYALLPSSKTLMLTRIVT